MQINKNKISKDEKKLILYNSLLSWLKVNSINVRFTVYTHAQPKVPEKHGLRSACARLALASTGLTVFGERRSERSGYGECI